MTDRSPTAASLTRRAIARIEDGDIEDARLILAEALDLDPLYEQAWLWFAHIAEDPGEKRFCLEQAAAINPESRAKEELPKLRRVPPVEPPEVADVVSPPPPPGLATAPAVYREQGLTPRRARLAALGVVLAMIAVVAVAWLLGRQQAEPVYIAVAGGMSGPGAASGIEMVDSVQLYIDQVNRDGGIDGHPVELLIYDDRDDAAAAQAVAEQIVADGRPLLVIGHNVSSASLAAGPIYAAAGMPAITSTSTADAITLDNPWYFRTVFDNHSQGFLIAAYIREVLEEDAITLINGDDDYGRSLAAGISAAFAAEGQIRQTLEIASADDTRAASVAAAVAALEEDADPGVVVIAMQAEPAAALVRALREAGLAALLFGGDAIGSNRFLATLDGVPEAILGPEQLRDGLIAGSPLIMDSLTSESLRWYDAFNDAYHYPPTWRGATSFDAAIAAATAMRAAGAIGDENARAAEREAIRDALAAMNSPQRAVAGLLGPISFDADRTTPRAMTVGVDRGGQYASAFRQLRPYAPSAGTGLEEDLASGVAVEVEGQVLERQRIVFAGMNLNEIGELDTANPSFYADFFLWLNYTGDDSATDITFVNAVDPTLALGEPVRADEVNGVKYRLYRVTGRFKVPLEFQDFPFDKQHLVISFQNRNLPSSKLVYAIDRGLIDMPQTDRLRSGTNASVSINAIPSWEAVRMEIYQGTVGSTALLGDPEATLGASGIEYSIFTTDVTIERDLAAFLGKNLLPLVLLAAVTYVSLYFPNSLTEARVTFGVSGILTAAVLLASVTSVLPQVGYTVAIEWGFYAFILLSATCIIFGLLGDWLYEQRRISELRRLNLFSHIFYPAFVLVVVLAYVVMYSGRV